MGRFLRLNFSLPFCRNKREVLAFIWMAGILLGSAMSYFSGVARSCCVDVNAFCHPVFSSFLLTLILPLFLSVIAVYFVKFYVLLLVVLMKSFLFSFAAMWCICAFGNAGWLVCIFILFADVMAMPSLWWFWLQTVSADRETVLRACFVSGCSILLIASYYYSMVTPFFAGLINC